MPIAKEHQALLKLVFYDCALTLNNISRRFLPCNMMTWYCSIAQSSGYLVDLQSCGISTEPLALYHLQFNQMVKACNAN